MLFSRRSAFKGMLGVGAVAATQAVMVRQSIAAPIEPLDIGSIRFANISAELDALMRLELNLNGQDAGSWFYWTAFIVTPDRQPIPVLNFEGLELARIVQLPNGKRFCKGIDLSFPRDYETRRFCETVLNPITGKTVTPPVSVSTNDPGYVISPEDGWRPRFAPRQDKVDLHCHWWREGNQGRLQRIRTPPPSFPHPMIEQAYYRFSYADIMNPLIKGVRYETGGIFTFPFPKWLGMDDRPGHMLGSFTGRKINNVAELPLEFHARAEKEHPDLLKLDWMFTNLNDIS